MKFDQGFFQKQNQIQKLGMTQELQQSIQMLQFTQEDLVSFLNQKALGNPLIDIKETGKNETAISSPSSQSRTINPKEQQDLNWIPDTHLSLIGYVLDQIHLSMRDTYLRDLVLWLTQHLDNNGYLTVTPEEGAKQTGAQPIEMLDAITLLQQLDPPGVGASNLQECLLLQTERREDAPKLAYLILEEDFEHFAERKWRKIADKYQMPIAEVQEISDFVQTLTPNPGAAFDRTDEQMIRPDLKVSVKENKLLIQEVKNGLPVISFQEDYYQEMLDVKDKDVTEFIREKKAEYEWLKRSLAQRGETIIKVGTAIVEKQKDFFFKSNHPIHPLQLKEIALELGIHESTVSRAINGKYFQTDFGVYEFKHFFSRALPLHGSDQDQNDSLDSISASEIKQQIQNLIDSENKKKPLSDQKIVDLLNEKGIDISRRTVTKYRVSLKIPTSSKRKLYL